MRATLQNLATRRLTWRQAVRVRAVWGAVGKTAPWLQRLHAPRLRAIAVVCRRNPMSSHFFHQNAIQYAQIRARYVPLYLDYLRRKEDERGVLRALWVQDNAA